MYNILPSTHSFPFELMRAYWLTDFPVEADALIREMRISAQTELLIDSETNQWNFLYCLVHLSLFNFIYPKSREKQRKRK